MRLCKRWLVTVVAMLLALSSCAVPMPASATDDGTATVTSVASDSLSASTELSAEDQPVSLPAADQQVPESSIEPDEGAVADPADPPVDSSAEPGSDKESQHKIQPEAQSCVSGKYLGGNDFIPGYTAVQHPDPATAKSDPVAINVDENFNVAVGSQATANTGNSDAAGTKATNTVGGTSQATAVDGSGEPVDPNDPNINGTYAGNGVVKSIDNLGTASAVAGTSEANSKMNGNEANIVPETCFSSKTSGKIIDSNIKVNAKLNYWALISGLSEASSGDSSATGTLAANSLISNDDAIARGDSPLSPDGEAFSGDVVSVNDSENSISNNAEALAATGASKADNIMEQNDVTIAPSVEAILNICGDVINSNVTVNLVYNFLAVISGLAKASSGDSEAAGVVVDNRIDNLTGSTAVGDSSSNSTGDGSQELSGGAVATNDTSNDIDNEGNAFGLSGDANAFNSMLDNAITIAPVICGQIDLLGSIVNANVVINVVYNFWATVSGQADAETGAADANGLVADNAINNRSNSLAIGDSAGFDSPGNGNGNGNSTALNDTNNSIQNKGDAGSVSGDAKASNSMLGNVINLSPALATAVVLITPLADNSFVINIVYDIWTSLDSSADAKTGDTDSFGTICSSSIDSQSDAIAISKIGLSDPNGSALAINSSDNRIGSVGSAAALSGEADAIGSLSNAFIGMTGCLRDDTVIDNPWVSTGSHTSFKAGIGEGADAESGDTAAVGTAAESHMRSDAISKDIFGREGISVNDSDDDIANDGRATATSGDAQARSGSLRGSDDAYDNSDDVILIGFNSPHADARDVAYNNNGTAIDEPTTTDSTAGGTAVPESGMGQNGEAIDLARKGEGVSMAGSAGPDLFAGYAGSVAGADAYDSRKAVPMKSWRFWPVPLLPAICAVFMLNPRLRRRFIMR